VAVGSGVIEVSGSGGDADEVGSSEPVGGREGITVAFEGD
jgi:hypothetical protein